MIEQVNHNKRKRYYNLDLLRLVCMLMILSLHYFGEGGLMNSSFSDSINVAIGSALVVVCRGAVNCFYMNLGFFISDNFDINYPESLRPTLKLYKQVWGYSVAVFAVAIAMGISDFTIQGMLRAIFPIFGNQYWFATVFILIVLLRPYLCKLLPSLRDRELIYLLAILLFFDCGQAAFGVNVFNELGNGFLHAFSMVVFGYSIQRINKIQLGKKTSICLFLASSLLLRCSGFIIGKIPGGIIDYWHNMMIYNSPLVVIMAYSLFCFFLSIEIKKNWFSKISASVFAIYLIQDHSTMREAFWIKIMRCQEYYSSKYMFIHYLLCITCISGFCIAIDILAKKVFECLRTIILRKRKR